MAKVECWAEIPNDVERQSVMSWVRSANFRSFSEIGDRVSVTYESSPTDSDSNSKYWGVIHFFEQYPNHSIATSTI